MFKIVFYLFDYIDDLFKKVYFYYWNDSKLVFIKNKRRVQEYFDERLVNKDIVQLKKVELLFVKILFIKLEEVE